jgi:hypothetical protein
MLIITPSTSTNYLIEALRAGAAIASGNAVLSTRVTSRLLELLGRGLPPTRLAR